jgi:hypothetical protein
VKIAASRGGHREHLLRTRVKPDVSTKIKRLMAPKACSRIKGRGYVTQMSLGCYSCSLLLLLVWGNRVLKASTAVAVFYP